MAVSRDLERHSAEIPGYTAIGITGNHVEITKFSSESDEGYRSISGEIMRWVGEIRKARDDNEQNSLVLVHSSAQSFSPYGRELSLPAQQNSQSSLGEVATQPSNRSLNRRQPRGVGSQSRQGQRSILDGQQVLSRPTQLGTETIGPINISNPGSVVSGNIFHGPVRFG
ncbi:unnamed protein product [Clonostachys chloroleuca]|uniref:Uncharacterized protein n=1 Tax=Clonostachys chloroleuca TaxID=1926264 RepID=A0AA35LU63_9HYPO|nr:unnamed protein product [Clonostachys chloroleuca]